MKTLLISLFVFCLVFLGSGCDPFSSSSSSSSSSSHEEGSRLEFKTKVQARGFTTFEEGDIMFFDGSGNKRVIVTTNTLILRRSSSCSAWDRVPANQIVNGDLLVVTFYTSQSVFEGSRQIVRAHAIEAYRAECISGSGLPDVNLTPCQIQEILNNGAPCPFSNSQSVSTNGVSG